MGYHVRRSQIAKTATLTTSYLLSWGKEVATKLGFLVALSLTSYWGAGQVISPYLAALSNGRLSARPIQQLINCC